MTILTEVRPDVCVNCGAHGSGAYCAACGQKRGFERFTLRSLARNAVWRTLNVEAGFLHTAVVLTTNPGRAVKDYIAGRSQPYSHPFSYLLLCCAVFVVVSQIVGGITGAGSGNQVFSLLLAPCIAAPSRVLFSRYRWNYAEHLILAMYLFGQVVLYLALALLVSALLASTALHRSAPLALAAIALVIAAYVSWAYARVFEKHRFVAALGGLVSVIVGAAFWAVTLAAMLTALRALNGNH